MTLKYSRIERNGKKPPVPFYATDGAAGLDLTVFGEDVSISPNGHAVVKTGICVAIPNGHVGLIFVRSSLGVKRGITLSNSVGVIDSDYRGELLVSLHNTLSETAVLHEGERVAQLVVVPCPRHELVECDQLDSTDRGEGRFGSTGK
jgi:dUTP pyrophosphatase